MIRIRPYARADAQGVVAFILPIQPLAFGMKISLDAQPDPTDIPACYQRKAGSFPVALADAEVPRDSLPAAFPVMAVDSKFHRRALAQSADRNGSSQ